ncbi:hypothetical protein PS684_01157 [Pseudomonas fluorescens]|nr:hypothetical protein PS681_03035 [Pseudomonas fluorescens]VVN52848.1 hypothetical protein PS684_01157 [Pseudomonas fluorescens]
MSSAASGPTVLWVFWVNIRFFGCCGWRFRPYGEALFPDAEKVPKKACSYVRPARWGSGFLRSGIDPGAAPTVCFAAPPLAVFGFAKRSPRSHPRINPSTQPSDVAHGSRSRAAAELTLILLSGEKPRSGVGRFCFSVGASLLRAALLRKRPDSRPISLCMHPIQLWERACSRRRPAIRPISAGCTLHPPLPKPSGFSAYNW